MTHFGLITWGSEGDVQPFLALSEALASQGHAVTLMLATNADAHYDAPQGVHLKRVGTTMTQAQGADLITRAMRIKNPAQQARLVHDEALAPMADSLFEASTELVQTTDIIVRHHFLHMAQSAAMAANKPEASVFLTPDLLPTRTRPPTGMPSLGPFQMQAWRLMARVVGKVFLPSANQLRQKLNLPLAENLLTNVWGSQTANLIAVSETLSPRPQDWPEHHHQTGTWRAPIANHTTTLPPQLEDFIRAGDAPIFATFGSMMPTDATTHAQTVSLLQQAAKATAQRLIIQTPQPIEHNSDVFTIQSCPHAAVFKRCKMVIHHGGAGTTQTALNANTPSIIVPHLADQFFWASCIEKLGAGTSTTARAKLKASHLIKAIQRVLKTPTMTTNAQFIGTQLANERGIQRAIQSLEHIT